MRNILVTGGAGFIGSNLALALQDRFPEARITVVDDFRSGDFRNLRGYKGDFVAADISRINWPEQFKERVFDGIFHLASITDPAVCDQLQQAHDNIEGFRRLLDFAATARTPIVYASSAETYGNVTARMGESLPPAPLTIHAFSKVQLDNMTRECARRLSGWRIVGLRYFNVYGPREAHKKSHASMIYQLYTQMKAGRRPRVYRDGQQRHDFVHIKDAVALTLRAITAPRSNIYNCGSGQPVSLKELVGELNHLLGTRLEPEFIDPPDGYQDFSEADMTLAETELHYVSQYPPAEGIADYVRALEQSSQ